MHEFFDEVNVPEQLSTSTIHADEDSKSKYHCDGNADVRPTNKRKFMGFELLKAPPEKKRIQSINCSEDAGTALDLNAGNRPDQEDSVNSTIVKEAQQCSLDLVTPSANACMDLQNVESVMCKSRILEEGSCPAAEKTKPDNVEEKTLNSASDYNCGDPAFGITSAVNVPSTSQSKDETFPTVDKIHPKGKSIPIVNQSRQHPFPLYGSKDSYSYQRKLGSKAHFSHSTNMFVKNDLSSGMIYGTSSSDQSSKWQLSTVKPAAHFWPSHKNQTEQKHQNDNEILVHENKQLSPSEGFPPHLININHFCPPQPWNQNNYFYGSDSYFLYSGYALPTASFGASNQQSPTMMNYTPYFYP
ncbi:uncharacterized protein LOC120532152 [Polypterus senegalus]|uniref:uncharacterized protein LOC120532152 n=1 Tax=Polypterus senegalus TaxID=55291 RepID=UPI0019628DC9|nr:uncharacterized protein LOC120532152 [Polypterus senegalus]